MRARMTVQQKDRRTIASRAEPDVTRIDIHGPQFEVLEGHFIPSAVIVGGALAAHAIDAIFSRSDE
jgi:hypothetical protein